MAPAAAELGRSAAEGRTLMRDAVADYIARFRPLGFPAAPWTAAQVAAHERRLGLPLPAAYRAYLLVAGAYPPAGLIGSDCHGDYLPRLRGWAEGLLAECGQPFELPADAVVFLMHQGYQFLFFRADGCTADPAVFHYLESTPAAVSLCGRFSDWVAGYLPAPRTDAEPSAAVDPPKAAGH